MLLYFVWFYFVAIYLATVLGAGTIAVLFVIIVINVYHTPQEKPIPLWTRRFISLLMILFCWKSSTSCCSSRCCRSSKTTVENTPVTEIVKKSVVSNDDVVEDDEEEDSEITWRTIAAVLDHFFFIIFMLIILLATVTFISIIVMKYFTYWATYFCICTPCLVRDYSTFITLIFVYREYFNITKYQALFREVSFFVRTDGTLHGDYCDWHTCLITLSYYE